MHIRAHFNAEEYSGRMAIPAMFTQGLGLENQHAMHGGKILEIDEYLKENQLDLFNSKDN